MMMMVVVGMVVAQICSRRGGMFDLQWLDYIGLDWNGLVTCIFD